MSLHRTKGLQALDEFEVAQAFIRLAKAQLKKAIRKEYGEFDRNTNNKGAPGAINAFDKIADAEYALNAYMEEQLKLPF